MSEHQPSGTRLPAQISLIQLQDIANKLGITLNKPTNYRYLGTYIYPDDNYITIMHNMFCGAAQVRQYTGLANSAVNKKGEEISNFGFRVERVEKTKVVEVPNGFYVSAVTHFKKIK
jgi:hypothetical protein